MNPDENAIAYPLSKVISAWIGAGAAIGVNSWSEAASFAGFIASLLAAIYTLCLLAEFFWKRVWRPLFVFFGWLKPKSVSDAEPVENP